MYAVPSDLVGIGANAAYGLGSTNDAAAQLPTFNSAFFQSLPNPSSNLLLQDATTAFHHSYPHRQTYGDVQYKLQQPAASSNFDRHQHPIVESAFLSGFQQSGPRPEQQQGATMALLPTVPALSLVPNDHSNGTWPRQPPKLQMDLAWRNHPPYQNVVIQRNGHPSPHIGNGPIIDQSTQPASRTNEEKEAAATLAGFFWTSNQPNMHRQPKPAENGIAFQRYQHQMAMSALRGETAAATAEKIVRFTEMQHQQRHHNGLVSHHHSADLARSNPSVIPHSRIVEVKPARPVEEALLKQILDKAALEKRLLHENALRQQHQRLLQDHGLASAINQQQEFHRFAPAPSSVPAPAAAAAPPSSALSFLVNEFIRQMDPAQEQHLVQQTNGHVAAKMPDQPSINGGQSNGLQQQTVSGSNGAIPKREAPVQQPVPLIERIVEMVSESNRGVQGSSTRIDHQPTTQDQRHLISNQHHSAFSRMDPSTLTRQPSVSGSVQAKEEHTVDGGRRSAHSNGSSLSDRLNPIHSGNEISNRQVSNGVADKRLHVVGQGKVEKKTAGIVKKAQKKLDATAKKTLKLEKGAMAGKKTPIGELQLPIVNESNPLSLSTLGLLSRLAKNSSHVARLTRKQRRKDSRTKPTYYEKLPTMFGPVAASLSSSNCATTKLSGSLTNAAIVSPSASSMEEQARPNGTVVANGKKHVYAKIPVAKQELATPLSDRIMMPDGTLESEESLKNRLENNITQPVHKCSCLPQVDEEIEGPYYTHLAAAPSIQKMRELLELRYGEQGSAIRIEKIRFTNKEGKTPDGCPIAKWVVRRSGPAEKILCLVRQRPSHFCSTAVIAVCIVIWEGVAALQADDLYNYLVNVLPKHGLATNRRCETNEKRLCACQGVNERVGGASFSFGCSWSMYSNTCKFCKTKGPVKRFKLSTDAESTLENVLEDKCHRLADAVAPVFKKMAPACYRNQTYYSDKAQACRLGYTPHGPFSGITACVDFCAHAHKDIHNMNNGCTVVVTLTKHRGFAKPEDEQLHVLPLCVLDSTDEFGSQEEQWAKVQNGSLEVLGAYPMNLRLRRNPLPCCKERTKQLKQRPGRPTKSKQPRLETRTPEPSFPPNAWSNFNVVNGNGMVDQRQRLPSMDTFSLFSSNRMQQTTNGFQYANEAPNHFNGSNQIAPSIPSSQSINAYDLAAFAQGYRTPTSSASCDLANGNGDEDESIYETYTDNREAFADSRVGGVAIALSHGSVLLEVAKRELHATTALKTPDRRDPKRISLVFYQHKHLNYTNHGAEELEKKTAAKNVLKDLDPAANVGSSEDEADEAKSGSKGPDEDVWPELPLVETVGEWREVGAKNVCSTLIRDNLVTVSPSKMCECRPTQKYVTPVVKFGK